MTRTTLEDLLNGLSLQFYLMVGLIDILLFLGGLAFIYWADQYAWPPWNQRSIPPPTLVQ